jgi:hypothetical protein
VAIVQRWAQSSPQEAASWVTQFPDLPYREAAVHNLVTIWAMQSPQEVANWFGELPAGTVLETGLAAYAQTLVPQTHSQPEE